MKKYVVYLGKEIWLTKADELTEGAIFESYPCSNKVTYTDDDMVEEISPFYFYFRLPPNDRNMTFLAVDKFFVEIIDA